MGDVQLLQPVNLGNPSTNTGDARFGRISSATTAREMQARLKFVF